MKKHGISHALTTIHIAVLSRLYKTLFFLGLFFSIISLKRALRYLYLSRIICKNNRASDMQANVARLKQFGPTICAGTIRAGCTNCQLAIIK
jgi:hypothetical protein